MLLRCPTSLQLLLRAAGRRAKTFTQTLRHTQRTLARTTRRTTRRKSELTLRPLNIAHRISIQPARIQTRILGRLRKLIPRTARRRAIHTARPGHVTPRIHLGPIAAGQRNQLVALRALRHLDPVLVAPLFDLGVAPGVEQRVRDTLRGCGCGCRERALPCRELGRGDAGVASHGGDEFVSAGGLRYGDPSLVAPGFEVGFRPAFVQPVARVEGGFAELGGDGLVVCAGGGEEVVLC